MYLHHVAAYLPATVVANDHFTRLNGLASDWIIERTGIRERRRAGAKENTNTMAIAAAERVLREAPGIDTADIDLIIGATYTPHDTIVTLAHAVQHALGVADIPVVSISSACSSLLNAVEIVEGYFALGKARRALVITSEHNTAYNNEHDTVAGHLWGDGAAALLFTADKLADTDLRVNEVITAGAATVGKATTAVTLRPLDRDIVMPHGRDVFQYACQYMTQVTEQVLSRNGLTVQDLRWLIPHQANKRISDVVLRNTGLPPERLVSNVETLGNTGCAGAAIGLADTLPGLQPGDRVVVTVFGGGYSYGAMLLTRE
ncbi:3-oxoacyl-ACP synthase III family protein [Hymenobacter jeollabukensis]|uniref:Ketoacyl-ACP synthase III n=1 Tax=Hymenobacter jeollabukensis TaxID=2025313 RepID=A0A5R8WJQ2_9BACT|nr:ketoacyl-ACP synthase III [Hymenobacter jeollabukensis]TLM89170.1 ketoacyl-ACP synthase III [Hymenobacter jeollabukensis]